MTALALLLLLAADGGVDTPRTDVSSALKGFSRSPHGQTRCAGCHVTSSWTEVRFNHERTGFPLEGRHVRVSCKACHVTDFTAPVPRTCSGCHRDVHAGELGARCEGCHDTTDWRSRFDVDAHRRTNFPLLGAHAALPCTECHFEARERRFSRATVDCQACHEADALRASGPATMVNHATLGLTMRSCRQCHGPLSFTPARFPDHDRCFPISAGPHAGVGCASCHAGSPGSALSGACNTGTAVCTECHTNDGREETGETDGQHRQVPGYVFSSRRCIECHYPARGGP